MRENRQSGSEGGGAGNEPALPTPIDNDQHQATANIPSAVKTAEPAPVPSAASATVAAPTNPYQLWGMAGTFGGAGILIMGGVFSIMAKQRTDDYKNTSDPEVMKSSYDKARTFSNVALGSYIAGGVVAVTGAALWIYSSTKTKAAPAPFGVAIAPAAGPGGISLELTGGW